MKCIQFLRKIVLVFVASALLFVFTGCGMFDSAYDPRDLGDGRITQEQLDNSIKLSGEYLVRNCDINGCFNYIVNSTPQPELGLLLKDNKRKRLKEYSLIHHAGAVYGMSMYEQEFPKETTRKAMTRAVAFLRQAVGPLPKKKDISSVWYTDELSDYGHSLSPGLLETSSGLIALLAYDKTVPNVLSSEELKKLGRFILFMQKENGSFYSAYNLSTASCESSTNFKYNSGEMALALIMLYEKDSSPQWLEGASKALRYLAVKRQGKAIVAPDYYSLMATARILRFLDDSDDLKELLEAHAAQICYSMLTRAVPHPKGAVEYGCFSPDGTTCPTAKCLEGLLAYHWDIPDKKDLFLDQTGLNNVPKGFDDLQRLIRGRSEPAIEFLLRTQEKKWEEGADGIQRRDDSGGIHRAIALLPAGHLKSSKSFNRRVKEIRIDYVQHALCAMIEYKRLYF